VLGVLTLAQSATYPMWLSIISALLVSAWGAFLAAKPAYIVNLLDRESSQSAFQRWWLRLWGLLDPRLVRLWGAFLILMGVAGIIAPIVVRR
jgi:hypothetical protein